MENQGRCYQGGIHHGTGEKLQRFFCGESVKTVVVLLLIELMLYFFVKDGKVYTEYKAITSAIMLLTIVSCVLAFWAGVDRYLLVIILLLLNIGFVVQEMESREYYISCDDFLIKFCVVIAAAFLTALLYWRLADFLASDRAVIAIMVVQAGLCAALLVLGIQTGNIREQGAVLTLRVGAVTFTPFELVKVLYLFVAAGLLCKKEKTVRIGWRVLHRETLLIVHTLILFVFAFLCRELGTVLVIYFTGLAMLWLFGENRMRTAVLAGVTGLGFTGFWVLSDRILYPMSVSGELALPGVITKLIARFGTALHPEQAVFGAGYQGTMALEAVAMGGVLGIQEDWYRLPLPEAFSDMMFANINQTCGVFIGSIVVVCFFALWKRGMDIASDCESRYLQGLATAISLVLAIESVIHIGYNLGLFPITGIPLYFVSQGFTAMATSLVLAAILLVLSTGQRLGGQWQR